MPTHGTTVQCRHLTLILRTGPDLAFTSQNNTKPSLASAFLRYSTQRHRPNVAIPIDTVPQRYRSRHRRTVPLPLFTVHYRHANLRDLTGHRHYSSAPHDTQLCPGGTKPNQTSPSPHETQPYDTSPLPNAARLDHATTVLHITSLCHAIAGRDLTQQCRHRTQRNCT